MRDSSSLRQPTASAAPERVYLAGWERSRRTPAAAGRPPVNDRESMEELAELAASAGACVVGAAYQRAPEPDPATLVGRGKLEQIRAAAHAAGAAAVIFGHDLTPTQLRNLEQALELKVIDRTQLILDIFARRARTREGKLQVELAQLSYLLPRLAGRGTLLSRLGGGIGTRGPGEQKLEFDRRRIRSRIQRLRQALERVRSQRGLHRERRREQEFLSVALVGYTNAGKSTLFKALTGSEAPASPRMFATLDPLVRLLPLASGRKALLSDTVGFIQHLPAHLVAAFRATFEELESADLLLHVSDASSPDCSEHDEVVAGLLESMGLAATPRLHVWNKADLLPESGFRHPGCEAGAVVSALTGKGIPELLHCIDEALGAGRTVEAEFDLSPADGETLALLHRSGEIISEEFFPERVHVRARLVEWVRDRVLSSHSHVGSGEAK